jgi:hypothetical protein
VSKSLQLQLNPNLQQKFKLCYDSLQMVHFSKGFCCMESQNVKFGFSQFAENWNGRLAMMGFVIGLATEVLTGQGILSQIGLM